MEGQSKYRKIINEIGKEKIILLSLAVLLLLFCQIPWGKNKKNTVEPNTKEKVAQNTELSECQLEERLEKTLSNMEGAGKTKVLITFQSSAENIIKEDVEYEKNQSEEENLSGGKKTSQDIKNKKDTVYETNAEGKNVPYIIKKISPKIEGVAVIAEGGNRPEVAEKMKEVVSAVLDVEAHKISIVKMK